MPQGPSYSSEPRDRSGREIFSRKRLAIAALLLGVAILCGWYRYQAAAESKHRVILGNTTVDSRTFAMIQLDSPAGRKYRQKHRQELLNLAKASLGPKTYTPERVSPAERQIFGALRSLQPPGDDRWLIPNHLEWLFIDHRQELAERKTVEQKTLAMEFWPTFDAMLDENEFRDHTRDKLRWNYLARLWPESTPEMFIESYMSMDVVSRQNVLTGFPANQFPEPRSPLPDSFPTETKIQILKRLRNRLENDPDGNKETHSLSDVFNYLNYLPEQKISEVETIDWALACIDHPSTADLWVKLTEVSDNKRRQKIRWPSPSPRLKMLDQTQGFDHHVVALAKHHSLVYQKIALEAVRKHPSPDRIAALDAIIANGKPELQEKAMQLKNELNLQGRKK